MKTFFQIQKQETSQIEKLFILLSVIFLFFYLFLRSLWVPFTQDESATFFGTVHLGRLFPPITREVANNQYFNTFLTFISYHIFGYQKWALRLPNTLLSLLFFRFLYLIAKRLPTQLIRVMFFLSIGFSIYFLDFFALSRGYGMSMAFLLGSVYFVIRFAESLVAKQLLYSSLFLFLMLAANLSTLIPAIAIVLLLGSIVVFRKEKSCWLSGLILFSLLINLFSIIVATWLLLMMKKVGALYLGTPNGGLLNAVNKWIALLTGSSSPVKLWITVIMASFILYNTVYRLIKNRNDYWSSPSFVFDFILWVTFAGMLLSVHIFHVYYPEGRVGLYFFPLFIASFTFSTAGFLRRNKFRKVAFLWLVPLLFFPLFFFTHINFSYANAYKTEELPERFYKRLLQNPSFPTIGGYHMQTMSWAYLNFIHGGVCNELDYSGFPDNEQDFQLLDIRHYPDILRWYNKVDYEPISHLMLLKRKSTLKMKQLENLNNIHTESIFNKTFFNLFVKKTGIGNRHFFFDIQLTAFSEKIPLHLWLVLQVMDNKNQTVIYKFIPFDWLKDNFNGSKNNFRQKIFSGKVPSNSKVLKLYLWNMDKLSFNIKEGNIAVYQSFQ